MEEKEVEMHTQNIKDKDKFIKAKEEKMQTECSSVRREMACCAALRLLGIDTHPLGIDTHPLVQLQQTEQVILGPIAWNRHSTK